ncbi:hypothetical protein LEP48_16195 [Isoptericola sp. NEAU-Y5]|uniref:Integral membrane protein n=1 Tax=Isoptericola luteus TaxID=2879484 RepID=A0ABS7ZIN8_9MICO|nr:hypothetical protein [Isoptericola sp. NEAU-Y5]MCA5894878.1 hypothetical protein [Isoptericola sp. NEAU-Y5]
MTEPTGDPDREPDPRQPPAYGQYAAGGPPPASPPVPPDALRPGGWSGGSGRPGGGVSVGQAFSWAWSSFARSAGPWIGATVVVGAIALAAAVLLTPDFRAIVENYDEPNAITEAVTAGASVLDVLLGALLAVVEIVVGSLLAHGALVATRRGRAVFGDFFAVRNLGGIVVLGLINGALTFVLAFIPFLGGLLRLVIGFFLAASLFFAIDRGQDALAAIRSSVALVSRNPGVVLLTLVVAIALLFVGALLLVVGTLVTVPLAILTGAFVYRRLVGEQPVAPV